MMNFNSLDLLLRGILGKGINEWVYTNIDQLNLDPLYAEYYIFPQEELWELKESHIYENENGEILPVEFKEKNLQTWLEVAMIEDVVDVLRQSKKNPELTLIAKALQYYYENDAFME